MEESGPIIIEGELPSLSPEIFYIVPVEDGDPYEASFFQGFAPSLLHHSWIIELINTLPADIREPTQLGQEFLLPRRMAGQSPLNWYGQSPKALFQFPVPVFTPFVVLFLGQDHSIEKYQPWVNSHSFPLTVIAENGGTHTYSDISLESLRKHFLEICDHLEGQTSARALSEAREALENWVEPTPRDLGYKVGGHNSVYPNLVALYVGGFHDTVYGPFKEIHKGIGPYVGQITKTSNSILDERDAIGDREANRHFRRPPDINLFAPSIYPHSKEVSLAGSGVSAEAQKSFLMIRTAIEKQTGYSFETANEAQQRALLGPRYEEEGPQPHFLMQMRASELKFGTACIGSLAASEFSAVIRLPNAVNRTTGQVRQFADQYRSRRSTDRKKIEAFRKVQKSITQSVPIEFCELLERSKDGVRIVADAHLEWLEFNQLPLCLQKDVSRIPATPGNLFTNQVARKAYVHLTQSNFTEVLILDAISDSDPVGKFFDIALEGFSDLFRDKLSIRNECVENQEQLIGTLNDYDGALVMFHGHGSHHPKHQGMLQLIDEEIDVWDLSGQISRPPPIVVLSACDTHAADRNHASTANGFLSLGSRAVLGSVFPLDAMSASLFAARLLYRVAEFIPGAQRMFGRSLTWLEIVSGMRRMQFLTDFLRRIEEKKLIDSTIYSQVHTEGNFAINSQQDYPFETVISELVKHGLDEAIARKEMKDAVPLSSAISYVHMGRPETIIVHPDSAEE